MEFAAAALASISGAFGGTAATGAAAATTAAVGAPTNILPAAATAATTTATTGSYLASILQGGAGLIGAMGAIRSGQQQADAYRQMSGDARLDARQEELSGMQREDSLKRKLLGDLGNRDAAYAASGVDMSFGTPAIARDQAIESSNRAVAIDRSTTEMRREQLMSRAASYQRMAQEAESAAWLKGLGGLMLTGGSIIRRG